MLRLGLFFPVAQKLFFWKNLEQSRKDINPHWLATAVIYHGKYEIFCDYLRNAASGPKMLLGTN